MPNYAKYANYANDANYAWPFIFLTVPPFSYETLESAAVRIAILSLLIGN
jgi:hypothetical protein